MGDEVYHINTTIFKLHISLGTSSILDGEKLITPWGVIRLFHDRIQDMTNSPTKTVKTLVWRCDQANKCTVDVDNTAFELNQMVSSTINEVQILKATMN